MGVEIESQTGFWAGLLQTLMCYWAPTSHQNLLAGQGESQGPGPVLFCWPSVLGFCLFTGVLNSPPAGSASEAPDMSCMS